MRSSQRFENVGEALLRGLATRLVLQLRIGDAITLTGDVGAGKTTFARALLRALLNDAAAEIPSPTFALAQPYETSRFPVVHYDFYRLKSPDDVTSLGFSDALETSVVIVEWPELAADFLPKDRLEIRIEAGASEDKRNLDLVAHGTFEPRLAQLAAGERLLQSTPNGAWREASASYLQGDASPLAYARLELAGETRILMDAPRRPDGPPIRDGRPYSRIAHLAEDVRPFVAISRELQARGFSAPCIYGQDLEAGVLLLEDLGDRLFAREVAAGVEQATLWQAAVEALVSLRRLPVPASLPVGADTTYALPLYDNGALQIEVELLVDWYWPFLHGSPAPAGARDEFIALWTAVFDRVQTVPKGWMLRDYHSPNLIWLPSRQGVRRVGMLDFQDALRGPEAFDLVSLLQDARVDVPCEIENRMRAHYCDLVRVEQPSFDEEAFSFAYAALGAQRNTKILGIFARLAMRDGKSAYLAHIPRIWRYVERDLAHVTLEPLRSWYGRWFPAAARSRPQETRLS